MDGLADWLAGYPLPFDSHVTNALFIALQLAVVCRWPLIWLATIIEVTVV